MGNSGVPLGASAAVTEDTVTLHAPVLPGAGMQVSSTENTMVDAQESPLRKPFAVNWGSAFPRMTAAFAEPTPAARTMTAARR